MLLLCCPQQPQWPIGTSVWRKPARVAGVKGCLAIHQSHTENEVAPINSGFQPPSAFSPSCLRQRLIQAPPLEAFVYQQCLVNSLTPFFLFTPPSLLWGGCVSWVWSPQVAQGKGTVPPPAACSADWLRDFLLLLFVTRICFVKRKWQSCHGNKPSAFWNELTLSGEGCLLH